MATRAIQPGLVKGYQAALHKNALATVVHKVNDANKSLPFDVTGGGNQPYTGPVRNAAQGGLPPGKSAGNPPVSGMGRPLPPFTK